MWLKKKDASLEDFYSYLNKNIQGEYSEFNEEINKTLLYRGKSL